MWLSTKIENGTDEKITVHVIALNSGAEMRRSLGPGKRATMVLDEVDGESLGEMFYYIVAYDSRGEVLYSAKRSGEELRKKTVVIGGEQDDQQAFLD